MYSFESMPITLIIFIKKDEIIFNVDLIAYEKGREEERKKNLYVFRGNGTRVYELFIKSFYKTMILIINDNANINDWY